MRDVNAQVWNSLSIVFPASIAILISLVGAASASAASFVPLGDLAGGVFNSRADGVSADGTVVVGQSVGANGREAYRWTAQGGMVGLGFLSGSGGVGSIATAVSDDGLVVVGQSVRSSPATEAFRWSASEGMKSLGDLPNGLHWNTATDVSGDGSVIVGYAWLGPGMFERGYRWTSETGMVDLGNLSSGALRSSANSASADGSVVVGYGFSSNGQEAFRWSLNEGMAGIGDLPGGQFRGEANGISPDGSVVVGQSYSANGLEAFRWDAANGMIGLGDLEGGVFESVATAVSADGSVVVGHSVVNDVPGGSMNYEAYVWDAVNEMRPIKDVLSEAGLNLTGWHLSFAQDISADGKVVVGYGFNPNGNQEAWLARLPDSIVLAGDYNSNGVVEAADYVVWRRAFGSDTTLANETVTLGTVDEEDYGVWRANFGTTVDSFALVGGNNLAVPEPTFCAIFASCFVFGILSGWRCRNT